MASGYRCPLKIDAPELSDGLWDCSIALGAPLHPGDEADAVVRFLSPEVVMPAMKVGVTFHLRELRIVGHAVVTAVHPD